ncbi:MAG: prolipoprotein diacylglyceryl transferase [Clostridia bacterium]|nr:prolipoprotein diacylglyceryl transferase [Clostridia bacterium]
MFNKALITIGDKEFLSLYGICIAIGVLCCVLVLFKFAKGRIKESFIDFLFYNGIAAIAIGFFAATLFQSFYNYLDNPEAGWQWGGMTFIGGLIGGVVSFLAGYFIFRPKLQGRLIDIVTLIPCCILIAHAFGRIGCLFAGCCHGAQMDGFPGIWMDPDGEPAGYYFPTQLVEALFLFAMFGVCLWLYLKKNFKHNLSLYLLSYGVFRFFIEFARADDRGSFVAGMSPSQFWAIVMVLASVAVYFFSEYVYKLRVKELAVAVGNVKTDGEKEVVENDEPVQENVQSELSPSENNGEEKNEEV